MTIKTKPVVDTDRAWEKLYQRLADDHLIVGADPARVRPLLAPWVRWAASLLLLVTTGLFLYLVSLRPGSADPFTLISNHDDNTLVKVLADGSVVYLAEEATLQLHEHFSSSHRSLHLTGEAFFDIEHNPDLPFIITTETAHIQVIGTAFNVRSHNDHRFELFVEQGLVKVDMHKDMRQSLQAQAGDMISLKEGKLTLQQHAGYMSSDWKINRMHFKDESLENVLSVINRNYGSRLLIDHHDQKSRLITVTFYDNSLSKIIELLCLSMNLDQEERDDGTILLKAKT